MSQENPPTSPEQSEPGTVQFNTGCIGVLVLLLVPTFALFAIAAFDQTFLDKLAGTYVRHNTVAVVKSLEFGGFNIGLLATVGLLVFELQRYVRRFIDMKAVWIEGDQIRFHPTLREKPIALADLASAKPDANGIKSDLILRSVGERHVRVKMLDVDDARDFAAMVEELK